MAVDGVNGFWRDARIRVEDKKQVISSLRYIFFFSCSTQLRLKFILLINVKMLLAF